MIVDINDRLKVGIVAVNSASKPLKAGVRGAPGHRQTGI